MRIIKWSNLVLATGLMAAGLAGAADYPERPINGVIAWGAGGGTDTVTRLLTPIAEKILKQSVILANRTGATGAIAAQAVWTRAMPPPGAEIPLGDDERRTLALWLAAGAPAR